MGLYGWYLDRIVPRIVDVGMRGEQFAALRPTCVGAARGRVLELGFGSGHNLPWYGEDVEELVAVDPALYGRELGAERIDAAPFPVRFADLVGDRLDLPDASFDTVTCTFSLCTIPAVEAALAEVRRVLRPGGSFLFLEHGLAPDPRVARWQRRLEPIQKVWTGGCHLARPIDALVRGAAIGDVLCENEWMEGPRIFGYLYRGEVVREG